ncbi:MAG: leucine-rich repeat domain-containing protein [Mangrovibacterium sp.]
MKRLFFLAIVLCLSIFAQAQQNVTVTTTAGNLRADLITAAGGEDKLKSITGLKIKGTLNAQDFADITLGTNRLFSNVFASLDLSEVSAIENKEIPRQAFFQFTTLAEVKFPAGNGVITAIGEGAFGYCSALTVIDIPEGVTTVGNDAFYNNNNTTSFKLPSTLKTVGDRAFSGLRAVTKLELPEGLTRIGASAFNGFRAITELVIPASVEYIGDMAFVALMNIESISFAPRGGKAIEISGYGVFQNAGVSSSANGKYFTFEFPDNTIISRITQGDGVFRAFFQNAYGLKEVKNLPAGLTQITNGTFSATALESIVVPEGVTVVGPSAFSQAAKLKSVVLPNSVTTIGDQTFLGTTALTSVTLGEGIQSMGVSAFNGATAMEELELPATLTVIGESAFQNMTNLKSLIVNNPEPVIFETQNNVFQGIDKENCILYVPAGTIGHEENDYSKYPLWKDFKNIKAIGSDAVEQEIENFENITVEKGAGPVTLHATAKGDRPVTYSIEAGKEAVATLQGNVLTIVSEGTAQITASVEGDNDYQAAEKTITLTVVDYSWVEEVAIAVIGNTAKIVGPAESVSNFTRFYVNDTEVTLTDGEADLSDKTGEISLKATSADGTSVIKLKINKQ